MITPVAERVRRWRQRQQLVRAEVIAELAQKVSKRELAEALADLKRPDLDRLQWALLDRPGVTENGNKRRELDAYFTPPAVAAAVVQRVAELLPAAPKLILEPHVGLGAFFRAARYRWSEILVDVVDVELRPALVTCMRILQGGTFHRADFLTWQPLFRYDLILGNPPFTQAELHVERALQLLAPGGHLALILPSNFLGGLQRATGFWSKPGLLHYAPIVPRPPFIGGNNDMREVSLYVWREGYWGDATVGRPINWRELQEAA